MADLKCNKSLVNEIVKEITNQVTTLNDDVQGAMREMAQQASDGNTWIGKGAQTFSAECTNQLQPDVERISESCITLSRNIQRSLDILEQADAQGRTMAEGMVEGSGIGASNIAEAIKSLKLF